MYDHERKLGWAKEHLDTLDRENVSFSHSRPHYIDAELDPQAGDYVARIRFRENVPLIWSRYIGDCLHNLRSSLDSLTYALAVRHLGRNPTDDEAETLQFVIKGDDTSFDVTAQRRLLRHKKRAYDLVDPNAVAEMKRLQPYKSTSRPAGNPLQLLAYLNNVDKHRAILPARANLYGGSVNFFIPTGQFLNADADYFFSVTMRLGLLVDGTVLARFRPPPDWPQAQVHVNGNWVSGYTVAEAGPNNTMSLHVMLRDMADFIDTDVFPAFKSFL